MYCNASNAYTVGAQANPRRADPAAYPDSFKLTLDDIVNAPDVPAIPPLLANRRP